jgi:hypothetical protein
LRIATPWSSPSVPEAEVPPVAQLVVVDLAHHEEGEVVHGLVGMGCLPLREPPRGLLLQLRADGLLEVLGGVHPVAVESELAHPVGEPLREVVARGAGVTGALEEGVELVHLLIQAALIFPLLDQRFGELHRIVPVGEDIRKVVHQGAVYRGGVVPVDAQRTGADPVVGPLGIQGGHRPGVIDHGVHEDADAAPVGRIDQLAQIVLGSQRRIHGGPVPSPVAVVSVRLPGPLVDAPVVLLHEGSHPDGVDAQRVEVPLLQLTQHSGEIPALEAAQHRSVLRPAQGEVVGGIGVVEAVGEEEVDRGAVPVDRRIRGFGRRDLPAWSLGAGSFGTAAREEEGDDERHRAGRGLHLRRHQPEIAAATSSRSSTRSVNAAATTRDAPPTSRA